MGGGNDPQINNNGNYNNINNYNDQTSTLYIDNDAFDINSYDVERYSILQHFTNQFFNIGNTKNDYINIMNELKDSIIMSFNDNNMQNRNYDLMHLFSLILNEIVQIAQSQFGYTTEIGDKLGVFGYYYRKLISHNKISEEQLDTMCDEFRCILGNKRNSSFEVKYKKEKEAINKLINRSQPMYKSIQKRNKKNVQKAIDEYNRTHPNNNI